MPLYHERTGFPANVRLPKGLFLLQYSPHARKEAVKDGCSAALPAYLDTRKGRPVEIEIVNGKVEKILYRIKLDNLSELCIVVLVRTSVWRVKTVFVNSVFDNHSTLNCSRYERVA